MQYDRITWPFPAWGLNTELHWAHIPPDFLRDCENMYYQSPSLLRTRGGIELLWSGGGGGYVSVIYWWPHANALMFADTRRHLYRGGHLVPGVSRNVTSMVAFGSSAAPRLIVAEELLGTHTLHTYTGAVYAQLVGTNVPTATKLMERGGRVWATCDTANPSRIYWSEVGDHTVWGGPWEEGGFLDIAPGQDGPIMDWMDREGTLWIFKKFGIYRLLGYDASSYIVDRVQTVDTVIPNTIVDCMSGVLYASDWGVRALGTPRGGPLDSPDLTRNVQTDIRISLPNSRCAFSPELGCYLVATNSRTVWAANLANRPDVWTRLHFHARMTSVYQGGALYFGDDDCNLYRYNHYATLDCMETRRSIVRSRSRLRSKLALTSQKFSQSAVPFRSRSRSVSRFKLTSALRSAWRSRMRSRTASRTKFRKYSQSRVASRTRSRSQWRSESRSRSRSKLKSASQVASIYEKGSGSRSRLASKSRTRSQSRSQSMLASRTATGSASRSRLATISQSRSRSKEPIASKSKSLSKWRSGSRSRSESRSASRSRLPCRPFAAYLRTANWDLGSTLPIKNIRAIEGPINAGGGHATALVQLFVDKHTVPTIEQELHYDEENLIMCNQNGQRVSLRIKYRHMESPAYFAGAALQVVRKGDAK